jgi:hypothetical protein
VFRECRIGGLVELLVACASGEELLSVPDRGHFPSPRKAGGVAHRPAPLHSSDAFTGDSRELRAACTRA